MTRRTHSGSGNSKHTNNMNPSYLSGKDSGRNFGKKSMNSWGDDRMDRRTSRARRMDDYTSRRHPHDQSYGRYESQEFTPERNQREAHFYAADDYMKSPEREGAMWPTSSSKVWHNDDNFSNQGTRYSDAFGEDSHDSSSRALWGQEFSRNHSNINSSWLSDSERNSDIGYENWSNSPRSERRMDNRNFAGKGPKGYRRSDERIKEDVCECLERSPLVDASNIEVDVKDCCVTLKGAVDSRQAKRDAEMLIENLRGVDDVINELKVEKSSTDTEIDSYPSRTTRGNDSLYASGRSSDKVNSKFDSQKRKETADYSATRM